MAWTFTSNSFEGRYLRLTITETVDAINNRSKLDWTLEALGGSSLYYTVDNTTVKINGEQVYYKGQTYWSDRVFPAAEGSTSGTTYVGHGSSGAGFDINVVFDTRVYYGGSLPYGGQITLSDIDRAAPTVTQANISEITANSFKISASANANCDLWEYKLGSGSWTSFSTTSGTSASETITGLTAGVTYSVTIRARRSYNHVYGTSSSKSAMTLGKSIIGTVSPFNLEDVFRVPLTKYVSSATDTLTIKVGSTTIKTITGYTNNADIQFTPAELLVAYEALGTTNAATATLTLETSYNGSSLGTSSATATASAAGTATIVNHGSGVVWRNVNGVWHRAVAFTNVAGTWKPGF